MGLTAADISAADPDSFQQLGSALDRLPSEANLEPEENLAPGHEVRLRGGRTYLYLLGYLEKDSGKARADRGLVEAIEKFQTEAGLIRTGEFDAATWGVLEDLCQYQTPSTVGNYFRHGKPSRPLVRAVCLRLFSYGFLTEKYSHKELSRRKKEKAKARLADALRGFSEVALLLGLTTESLGADITPAYAKLLLHHDAISEGIRPGVSPRGFRVFPDALETPLNAKEIKSLVSAFTKNVALVELWMLGYQTRPGQFKIGRFDNREADDSLVKALKKFCSDRGLRGHFRSRNSIQMGCWFFEEARAIHRESQDADSEDVDDATLAALEENPKFRKAVQKRYESLGIRIFDGVKRIFGWFRHAVKKVFNFLKRTILNTARILRKRALEVYQRLKSVAVTLKLGAEFYARPVFDGSDPDFVYVRHDKDLDFDVFVHADCPEDKLAGFFARLDARADMFQLACLLAGKLLDLVTLVFRSSRLVVGWLALIIALIKFGKWLREFRGLGREARLAVERLSDLRQVEAVFAGS